MSRLCAIEGCYREIETRGWCNTHYERWRRLGDPEAGGMLRYPVLRPRTTMGRFWAKVRADDSTGCWNWTGSATGRGYGHMTIDKKGVHVYRLSYETYVGPVPAGLELDHLCRNPRCVNPEHLEPVTHAENTRRAIEANRSPVCKRGHDRALHMRPRPNGSDYCAECSREAARRRYAERQGRRVA